MRTSVPMWGSTASKRCSSPATARERTKRQKTAAAPRPALLLVMFDAVVPIPVHLFRGRKLRRTDQPEAEPLRVGEIPDAFRELRILLFPVRVRAHAGCASHQPGGVVP